MYYTCTCRDVVLINKVQRRQSMKTGIQMLYMTVCICHCCAKTGLPSLTNIIIAVRLYMHAGLYLEQPLLQYFTYHVLADVGHVLLRNGSHGSITVCAYMVI